MDLRLTVIDPAGDGVPVDVLVQAAPGAELAAVRDDLLRVVRRQHGRLHAGPAALADDAPLGAPPLLDGAVLTVDAPGTSDGTRGLLELRTVAGPDAGAVHRLGPGEHAVGRAVQAGVRLDDPDVSRLHAVLAVAADGVRVRDLGSTNGSRIDGQDLNGEPVSLPQGALLRVGESTLTLALPTHAAATVHASGAGSLDVNRQPRILPPEPQRQVTLPAPPTEREKARFPFVALLLPVAAGPILFLAGGNPLFLLFVLMSPLMLLGNHLTDRRHGSKGNQKAKQAYDAELTTARECIRAAVAAEQARRRAASPDAAELLATVVGPLPRLWERRRHDEDFLSLRVATGDLPSQVAVTATGSGPGPEQPTAEFVPVTVSLRDAGVIGLAGPRLRLEGLARWVLGQLAGWHSPRDLEVVVLVASDHHETWEWTAWLPHLAPKVGQDCAALLGLDTGQVESRVAELLAQLDARHAARRGEHLGWAGRRTVVVLDGARSLRAVPGVVRLLEEGPAVGLHAVCLETDASALPAECRATIVLDAGLGTRVDVTVGGRAPVRDMVADLVSPAWADRFARALAPLRDATPEEDTAGLPEAARFVERWLASGLKPTDAADVGASWQSAPRSTRALLGVGPDGDYTVDLRRDGPHALVAGTTGSGKSELLQTLVASLALGNRPDEMAFVLVDYKGGSAFKDCARLPHTVGLVTDLDEHLTRRALRSLDAELKRRKTILAAAGCKDIEDYLAQNLPAHQARAPLPRLLLVIDEFATLVEELPDFVGGLVGIAQLGRSLGVHLVLATQRPAGVVSADIKANTNLRIALRVTDPGESTDVLETKDAALISRSTPGRAYARVGTGAVTAFQSARVGGHALGATRVAATVHPVRFERYGDPVARVATPAGDGPTDLARIVGACQKAAAALAVPPGRSPWLPPLPDVLTVEEPATVVEPAAVAATWMVPAGVSDLPRSQARAAWGLDLEHGGHLLVAGTARSGRTTVLRTIAGSIAARYGVGDVHVYAIDGASGALAPLSALPHVGAVVSRDQPSRGDRLIGRLVTELGRRQQLLAGAGFASIAEQRAATSARERLPYLVLLLDSWEGLQSAFETVDHGRPVDAIVRLVREGAAAGVRVVLTGDRSTVTSRIGSLIADRLLLRLADPADYGLAGIPTRLVPERMPPGRGLVPDGVGEILETQVALLDPEPTGHAQVAALRRIAETARRRSFDLPRERWPFRVEALPAQVGAAELAGAEEATASGPLWAFLGVGGDELEPIGVDLAEEGPGFVVAGATGSGRSTALVGIGRGMLRRGAELVLVTARRSPLRGLAGERGVLAALGPRDGPRLQEVLASAAGPFAVLVDDVEALHESGLDQPLLGLLRPPDDRPRALVVAGSSSELANQFRGVGAEARKNRLGLVLNPAGGSESDLLGTRVPRGDEARPGRGVLVHRGRLVAVQVALP